MRTITQIPTFTRRRVALVAALAAATALVAIAQSDKPDFSGKWELDKERSEGPADPVEEIIEHDGSKLVVTATSADGRQFAVRLSTDGEENLNIVRGREMTARTTWESGKLVTVVRDAQGMQFIEVRSLSEGGKVQTTEGFIDPARTRAMFKRVAVKGE